MVVGERLAGQSATRFPHKRPELLLSAMDC